MEKYYFVSDLFSNVVEKNTILAFLKRNKIKLKKKRKHCSDNRDRDCLVISLKEIDLAIKVNKSKTVFSQDITDTLEAIRNIICQIENQ